MNVVHPFEPIIEKTSKVLILGSFPSVKSRENQFYYGHAKNRFWKLLATIFEVPLPETVAEKKKLILDHELAIWDTLKSCEIKASSDASIKNPVVNDIKRISKKLSYSSHFI